MPRFPAACFRVLCASSAVLLTSACSACTGAEHRQFDFWVGRWDVFLPDGSLAGENRIERVAQGCALHESWRGRSGFSGHSLNSHDAATGL
jgi:hypothetical protein